MRPFSSVSNISDKFSAGKWRRRVGLWVCVGWAGRQGEFFFVALLYVNRCRYGDALMECACLVLVGVQWCPVPGRDMLVLWVGWIQGAKLPGDGCFDFRIPTYLPVAPTSAGVRGVLDTVLFFIYIEISDMSKYRIPMFRISPIFRTIDLRYEYRFEGVMPSIPWHPSILFFWLITDRKNRCIRYRSRFDLICLFFSVSYIEPNSDIDSRH